MSMVSHCVGTRFIQLIGGVMTSFYDWYADLPVASPQVFGDQTDVPESGDWWDATYLMMWGSNVPVTRTPDAHWMAEVRYRGTKVVTVSPDYADNTKFADEWLPAQAGTDAALAMAMGHVILKEFFVDRRTPFFVDYVRHLHRPAVPGPARGPAATATAAWSRASSSPPPTSPTARPAEDAWKTVLLDERDRRSRSSRTARWASATPTPARAGGTSTSRASPRRSSLRGRRQRAGRGAAAGLRRTPTAPARCCAAACRPGGSAATWSPPSST